MFVFHIYRLETANRRANLQMERKLQFAENSENQYLLAEDGELKFAFRFYNEYKNNADFFLFVGSDAEILHRERTTRIEKASALNYFSANTDE